MAAAARDTAADAREATADARGVGTAAQDRLLAAADRSAAIVDREDLALRDAAALARDAAAARRDETAAALEVAGHLTRDWAAAAADRAEAAADRGASAARNGAARVRDDAAQARDVTRAAFAHDGHEPHAADDRQSSAEDRAAAAADRHDAAHVLARSYRDELTGVLVRDAGRGQLVQAVDRAHRGEPLVLAFVDVNDLKWFNDTQGHAAGDHVLAQVGQALLHGLRSYDVVVRYGGDEFVCALPGVHLADAQQRFAAIAVRLAESVTGASVTVGFAELTPQDTLEQVLARADDDMYARRRRESL